MALFQKEGIVAFNEILNEQEFNTVMMQLIDAEWLNIFKLRLLDILNDIEANSIKSAYQKWEALQGEMLGNPNFATSLLFVSNLQGMDVPGSLQYSYVSQEYNILSEKGMFLNVQQGFENIMQDTIGEAVQSHLLGLKEDIETKEAPYRVVQLMNTLHDNKSKAYARYRQDRTYKNVLYGRSKSWLGNVTDAFMNHMAHLHMSMEHLEENENGLGFTQSVFQEEKNNINKLLVDSTNKTAWFTGGDVIIKYNNQLYSIQVKSSMLAQGRGGKITSRIRTKGLKIVINNLINSLNMGKLSVIQSLYNSLKTSGWVEHTNVNVNQIVDQLIGFNIK